MLPPLRRSYGGCRHCGRRIQLTVQGKLFLHGDQVPVWEKGIEIPRLGDHCPGGMTRDYVDSQPLLASIPETEA